MYSACSRCSICSQVSGLLHARLRSQPCLLQDSIYSLDRAPDREVVHSHDWNRYITPFRAEWDHGDWQVNFRSAVPYRSLLAMAGVAASCSDSSEYVSCRSMCESLILQGH